MPQETSWWVTGSLFEACNCDLICPCHVSFRQKPTNEVCEAIWGVHIAEGSFGGTSLDDLNAAFAAYCPGPTMADGDWSSVLYLDRSASPAQEQAMLSIFSGEGGGPFARLALFFSNGKFEAVRSVQFDYVEEPCVRKLQMSAENVDGNLEVEAIRGADGEGVAKLINLRNVIHGPEHVLAHSSYRVHDQTLHFDGSSKHGLYSQFRWSNP